MTDPASVAAQLYRLLADVTRVRICRMLADEGELNVGAICERLGMTQPAVSHHLALLKIAGVVDARRDGKRVFYSLHPDTRGRLAATLLFAFGFEGAKLPKGFRP